MEVAVAVAQTAVTWDIGQNLAGLAACLADARVWASHLISHAAANQRFVIACNVASPRQHCPSMIISPRGEILAELPASQPAVLRTIIDTEDVSGWYLGQRRTDLLRLRYQAPAGS